MPNVYKKRDPSPISSIEMIKLLDQQEKLKKKIEEFREKCTHHYEVLKTCDGHDGYSWVDCEVEEYVHCKICGDTTWRKTGRIKSY